MDKIRAIAVVMVAIVGVGMHRVSLHDAWAASESLEGTKSLESQLMLLQVHWKRNADRYEEQQKDVHDMANAVRDLLCDAGQLQHCYKGIRVDVTSYKPLEAETDASPCIGATGVNLCDRAYDGYHSIALSQDLVSRKGDTPFHYGDVVQLIHPEAKCSGKFTVLDTMNARLSKRADIFVLPEEKTVGKCEDALLRKVP